MEPNRKIYLNQNKNQGQIKIMKLQQTQTIPKSKQSLNTDFDQNFIKNALKKSIRCRPDQYKIIFHSKTLLLSSAFAQYFFQELQIQKTTTLLINFFQQQIDEIFNEIVCKRSLQLMKNDSKQTKIELKRLNEVVKEKRAEFYKSPGVYSLSSEILIKDLLRFEKIIQLSYINRIVIRISQKITSYFNYFGWIFTILKKQTKICSVLIICRDVNYYTEVQSLQGIYRTFFCEKLVIWPFGRAQVHKSIAKSSSKIQQFKHYIDMPQGLKKNEQFIKNLVQIVQKQYNRFRSKKVNGLQILFKQSISQQFEQKDVVLYELRDFKNLKYLINCILNCDQVFFMSFILGMRTNDVQKSIWNSKSSLVVELFNQFESNNKLKMYMFSKIQNKLQSKAQSKVQSKVQGQNKAIKKETKKKIDLVQLIINYHYDRNQKQIAQSYDQWQGIYELEYTIDLNVNKNHKIYQTYEILDIIYTQLLQKQKQYQYQYKQQQEKQQKQKSTHANKHNPSPKSNNMHNQFIQFKQFNNDILNFIDINTQQQICETLLINCPNQTTKKYLHKQIFAKINNSHYIQYLKSVYDYLSMERQLRITNVKSIYSKIKSKKLIPKMEIQFDSQPQNIEKYFGKLIQEKIQVQQAIDKKQSTSLKNCDNFINYSRNLTNQKSNQYKQKQEQYKNTFNEPNQFSKQKLLNQISSPNYYEYNQKPQHQKQISEDDLIKSKTSSQMLAEIFLSQEQISSQYQQKIQQIQSQTKSNQFQNKTQNQSNKCQKSNKSCQKQNSSLFQNRLNHQGNFISNSNCNNFNFNKQQIIVDYQFNDSSKQQQQFKSQSNVGGIKNLKPQNNNTKNNKPKKLPKQIFKENSFILQQCLYKQLSILFQILQRYQNQIFTQQEIRTNLSNTKNKRDKQNVKSFKYQKSNTQKIQRKSSQDQQKTKIIIKDKLFGKQTERQSQKNIYEMFQKQSSAFQTLFAQQISRVNFDFIKKDQLKLAPIYSQQSSLCLYSKINPKKKLLIVTLFSPKSNTSSDKITSFNQCIRLINPHRCLFYSPQTWQIRNLYVTHSESLIPNLKQIRVLAFKNSFEVMEADHQVKKQDQAFWKISQNRLKLQMYNDNPENRIQQLEMNDKYQKTLDFINYALKNDTKAEQKQKIYKINLNQRRIIVDSRQFKSALPCHLFFYGFTVIPIQLQTADYILSDGIGIEKKSIQTKDLHQSLKSFRLDKQIKRLCQKFQKPYLLIESQQSEDFKKQSFYERGIQLNGGKDNYRVYIRQRLAELLKKFPKLRIIWSQCVNRTCQFFKQLKKNQPEPQIGKYLKNDNQQDHQVVDALQSEDSGQQKIDKMQIDE